MNIMGKSPQTAAFQNRFIQNAQQDHSRQKVDDGTET